MAYECRIEKDSVNHWGERLTTFVVTFPRIVLAEFNTHRLFSRNSASSRAIPVEKQIAKIENDLFLPVYWGKNQKGMQADSELTSDEVREATSYWANAATQAVSWAKALLHVGVHKQITNRLLEPFMWHTVVVTATEWTNFFHQRCHKDAQPEIRRIAEMMREEYRASTPSVLHSNDWHLPFVHFDDEVEAHATLRHHGLPYLAKISAGRSARVSYLTHDGRRSLSDDMELYSKLSSFGHMSPLEHPCRPMTHDERDIFKQQQYEWDAKIGQFMPVQDRLGFYQYTHFLGNVQGWVQLRKMISNEADALGAA